MADGVGAQVEFHYIKSNHFRVVHCDGVWGGGTPRGYISMSVFSERRPIPQKLIHEVTPQGNLGAQIGEVTKDGIVRDVEVELLLDLPMARNIVDWLQQHISVVEKAKERRENGS